MKGLSGMRGSFSGREKALHERSAIGSTLRARNVRPGARHQFPSLIPEVLKDLENDLASIGHIEASLADAQRSATAEESAQREQELKSMGAPSFLGVMKVTIP
jgi:hypothetical protein